MSFRLMPAHADVITGVDLSKLLGGQTKILAEQKDVKSDKCIGDSQLLGARARAAPKSTPMDVITSRCSNLSKKRLDIIMHSESRI